MATTPAEPLPKREMKVLAMGLPRTGSMSMALGLRVLGYNQVFHAVDAIDKKREWELLDAAADATFPSVPDYSGTPWTHDQWEELYAPYEATTDVASLFGRHLVDAYPDAKVVLVIRDYDKWYSSMEESVFKALWSTAANISVGYIEPILGSVAGQASRKMVLGFFRAQNVDEARRNAREAYDRHHRELREAVRPGMLLEYRMGEGWEPLCEFLGRPVPEVEFPWANESEALKKTVRDKIRRNVKAGLWIVMPWVVGTVVVGVASWVGARSLRWNL